VKTLAFGGAAYRRWLARLPRASAPRSAVVRQAERVVRAVRDGGDAALVRLSARFDGVRLTPGGLRVRPAEIRALAERADPAVVEALARMARRIEAYHRRQLASGFRTRLDDGSVLEEAVRPLASAGLYVPGGRGAYPSSVLMGAIPARVAGVARLVIVTPPRTLERNPAVAAAIAVASAGEHVYRVGGAQAIAALAYGTRTVPKVDKIVGPGNAYVAAAKRAVRGQVEIDTDAGPSEVVILADASADAGFVAADLLAQAEHDPMARSVLLSPSSALLDAVEQETARQLTALPRREIAASALRDNGALVLTGSLAEAVDVANQLAPEHLELSVAEPDALLARVRCAGAVFLGRHTPEVVGDYVAGPNHVLPTGGTARFASALSTEDFVRRLSVIQYSTRGLAEAWPHLAELARVEGLQAHREAARVRIASNGGESA